MLNTLQTPPVRPNGLDDYEKSDRVQERRTRYAALLNERRSKFLLLFLGALLALVACWDLPPDRTLRSEKPV